MDVEEVLPPGLKPSNVEMQDKEVATKDDEAEKNVDVKSENLVEQENEDENPFADDDDSDEEGGQVQVTIRKIETTAFNKPSNHGKLDIDATPSFNDKPIYDIDLAQMEDRPWRKPGADLTDYFNYGFTEDSWNIYCERQKKLRAEFPNNQAAVNKALFASIQLTNPLANPVITSAPTGNSINGSVIKVLTDNGGRFKAQNFQGQQLQQQQPQQLEQPPVMRTVIGGPSSMTTNNAPPMIDFSKPPPGMSLPLSSVVVANSLPAPVAPTPVSSTISSDAPPGVDTIPDRPPGVLTPPGSTKSTTTTGPPGLDLNLGIPPLGFNPAMPPPGIPPQMGMLSNMPPPGFNMLPPPGFQQNSNPASGSSGQPGQSGSSQSQHVRAGFTSSRNNMVASYARDSGDYDEDDERRSRRKRSRSRSPKRDARRRTERDRGSERSSRRHRSRSASGDRKRHRDDRDREKRRDRRDEEERGKKSRSRRDDDDDRREKREKRSRHEEDEEAASSPAREITPVIE